jgi:hypothetical protein
MQFWEDWLHERQGSFADSRCMLDTKISSNQHFKLPLNQALPRHGGVVLGMFE